LTLDSGLSITKALQLSLDATGNAYFASRAEGVVHALKIGQTLHEALEASGLFTSDFLEMIVSSEASGSVPEMMRILGKQYQEETAQKMTMLTRVAGGAVWFGVAAFIIWAIFRLASVYFDALGGKF
jgi:type II secretory pathway component PulF